LGPYGTISRDCYGTIGPGGSKYRDQKVLVRNGLCWIVLFFALSSFPPSCGPESFTPDGCPAVGPSPDLQNYFVAAGLNSIGILTGGGIGKTLAKWVQKGVSPSDIDITGINVDRFHSFQSNFEYRKNRVGESLGNTYRLLYPSHQPKTCRGVKKSALHERLANMNAYFHDVSGWESPGWYALAGAEPIIEKESFGRPNFFQDWEAEHKACRENVALFDMSFMSKFLVRIIQ
jgi:4-methylaminobutanoate oxidase (formaldehyde-forming)